MATTAGENIGMVTGQSNETDGQEGSKRRNDDRQSKGSSNDECGSIDGAAVAEGRPPPSIVPADGELCSDERYRQRWRRGWAGGRPRASCDD